MTENRFLSAWKNRGGRICLVFLIGCTMISTALAATEGPQSFDTPEAGITSLVEAVRVNDASRLESILGPFGHDLINSGDRSPTSTAAKRF